MRGSFEMIYESRKAQLSKLDIAVPLSCIERVTLSPWLHPALLPDLKSMLRSIIGSGALEIVRSTLISNEEWKNLGESVAEPAPASRAW
jgi:hypothetical protein